LTPCALTHGATTDGKTTAMPPERPADDDDDDPDDVTPQLAPDIEDPGGKLPPGEAQDRRGPEPPADTRLPESIIVPEAEPDEDSP
jgi:hypothetical protein